MLRPPAEQHTAGVSGVKAVSVAILLQAPTRGERQSDAKHDTKCRAATTRSHANKRHRLPTKKPTGQARAQCAPKKADAKEK
ncbi:MAG: hypothetical protein IJB94_02850, partial [Clostridia bacterium]|nr:hypothetical protein [Clostridia bacterium]